MAQVHAEPFCVQLPDWRKSGLGTMFAAGLRWAVSFATATVIAVRATAAGVGATLAGGVFVGVVTVFGVTRAVTARTAGLAVALRRTAVVVDVVGAVVVDVVGAVVVDVVGRLAGVAGCSFIAARFACTALCVTRVCGRDVTTRAWWLTVLAASTERAATAAPDGFETALVVGASTNTYEPTADERMVTASAARRVTVRHDPHPE